MEIYTIQEYLRPDLFFDLEIEVQDRIHQYIDEYRDAYSRDPDVPESDEEVIAFLVEESSNWFRYTDQNGYKSWFVNVYDVERVYGGPEEGGWWYDTGNCIKTVTVNRYAKALTMVESLRTDYPRTGNRYNVLGGEDYDIHIEDEPGTYFPKETPFYE